MQLPDFSVGITDVIAHTECPRRFSFGMRRHVGVGEQDDGQMPEATTMGAAWARAYGSAIHDVIAAVENGATDDEALQAAFNKWGHALEPEDLDALRGDLETYRARDYPGVRAVAVEDEYRVPLMQWNGETVYYRFKLDRLYERLDRPGFFIHVDYKSSRHRKTNPEVRADKQMWSYNWGIHEVFPECERLEQVYDQLRFGQEPTRKTPAQREQIREWLVRKVTSILEDDSVQADGLLKHRFNDWCEWCPILESCPVVPELADWALTRIAELTPQRAKLKRDGEPGKKMEAAPLQPSRLEEYTFELAKVGRATGILKRYDKSVKDLLREVPDARRLELGYRLQPRDATTFPPSSMRAMHESLGDRFYEVASVTKTKLEENLADELDLLSWALALAEKQDGTPAIVRST